MSDVTYILRARWKEELVCHCDAGSFVLQFDMGIPTVYLPSEEDWPRVAPSWAAGHWHALHAQVLDWCKFNNAAFAIGGNTPLGSV